MDFKAIFLCTISAVLVLIPYCNAAAETLTQADKDHILKLHNDERAKEGATFMNELKWNDDLASKAAIWAGSLGTQCSGIGHPNYNKDIATLEMWGNSINIAQYNPSAGQNVASFTSSKEREIASNQVVLDKGFGGWMEEKKAFTYGTGFDASKNAKDANDRLISTVGHYTQIVWDQTNEVGCAVSKCSKYIAAWDQDGYTGITVCNYFPGGNGPRNSDGKSVMQGNSYAWPFQQGDAASECITKGNGVSANNTELCMPQCYGWASKDAYTSETCNPDWCSHSGWQCGCAVTCGKSAATPAGKKFCHGGNDSNKPARTTASQCQWGVSAAKN